MSIIEDFPSTTFATTPHEDLTVAATPREDVTVAEAWASSPLGDPAIEDGSLSQPEKFEHLPAATVAPRSRRTNALVAGAVVAALAAVVALGLMLIGGSGPKERKPAVVVPNSDISSVTPQPPSSVAPPPVAPAPPSAATSPDTASPGATGPASGEHAPVVIPPAQAPAPVAAPADPSPPPSVTVNVPPVIVPVPIPVPPQHSGGQPPPSGHPPIQCFACHPPEQPVHPKPPVYPQPPIHLQPLQHP